MSAFIRSMRHSVPGRDLWNTGSASRCRLPTRSSCRRRVGALCSMRRRAASELLLRGLQGRHPGLELFQLGQQLPVDATELVVRLLQLAVFVVELVQPLLQIASVCLLPLAEGSLGSPVLCPPPLQGRVRIKAWNVGVCKPDSPCACWRWPACRWPPTVADAGLLGRARSGP